MEPQRGQRRYRGAYRILASRGCQWRRSGLDVRLDTKAVEGLLFGEQGIEQSLGEGMVVVDSSTISPTATRKFANGYAPRAPTTWMLR